MSEYVVFTDSACDITPKRLKEWDVSFCELTFSFSGEKRQYQNYDLSAKDFYRKMREGGVAQTSAVNADTFRAAFEPVLQEKNDILYIGFSSGLSTTVNSAQIAADELKEKYPERTIRVVDTLAASAGFGLLLYLTLQKVKEGATLEEAAAYAEAQKLHICHWFTVDDLAKAC